MRLLQEGLEGKSAPCSAAVITGSRAGRGGYCPRTQSHSSSCNQKHPALIYVPVLPTDTMEWDFYRLKKGDVRLERTFGLEQSLAKLLQQSLPINPAMSCTGDMDYLTAPLLLVCIPWWGSPCPSCRDSHLLPTQLMAFHKEMESIWSALVSGTHTKGSLHSSKGRAKQRRAVGLSCLLLCLSL